MYTTWKGALQITILIYSPLLMMREVFQMWAQGLRHYLRQTSNWIDILGITSIFVLALLTMLYTGSSSQKEWIVPMIVLVTLITFCRLGIDLLECFPIPDMGLYTLMFFHVCKTYLRIMAFFAPFLTAFATAFMGKS